MPKAPNIIDKINYIIEFLVDPCDAPLTVYARWALPAALDLMLDYLVFQPDEIIIQSFRTSTAPRRQRSGRKGGRGLKASRSKFRRYLGRVADFDPNEQLGKKLGRQTKLSAALRGPSAALWVFHGVLQRTLFFLFLAELAVDFFYNWFSLMTLHGYCDAQGKTVLLTGGDTLVINPIVPESPVNMPLIEKIRGAISWNGFGAAFTGKHATISIGGSFSPYIPEFAETTPILYARVQYYGSAKVYNYKLGQATLFGPDFEIITGTIEVGGPCSIVPFVTFAPGSVGAVYMHEPTFFLHGEGPDDE